MRILKYIFLLLLLLFIGFAVFMATQKGEYNLVKSIYIKQPKSLVYKYINDYHYWENWFAWSDNDMKFDYNAVSSGKGGSFEWSGNGERGQMVTTSIKDFDSIVQKMTTESRESKLTWILRDSAGGTKVTLKIDGKMGFLPKISASLKGGVSSLVGNVFDESLLKLDKTLDYEIRTYNVKIDGVVDVPAQFYLYQSARSKISNVPGNISIMMSKISNFFKKNKIAMAGKPFVSYNIYDEANNIAEYKVGIPVDQEIYTSPGSDISSGKTVAYNALKTIVTGDYSHLNTGRKESFFYISKNRLNLNNEIPITESYIIGQSTEKHPSKWVTAIYFPIVIESTPVTETTIKPIADDTPLLEIE